jgi:hypothetical protein
MSSEDKATIGLIAIIGFFVSVITAWNVIVQPVYNVWSQGKVGEAMLARAEYAKKAQIADAEAKYESAKYLRQAADEIQGSLTPEYLQFLRTQTMEHIAEQNDRAVFFYDAGLPAPVIGGIK